MKKELQTSIQSSFTLLALSTSSSLLLQLLHLSTSLQLFPLQFLHFQLQTIFHFTFCTLNFNQSFVTVLAISTFRLSSITVELGEVWGYNFASIFLPFGHNVTLKYTKIRNKHTKQHRNSSITFKFSIKQPIAYRMTAGQPTPPVFLLRLQSWISLPPMRWHKHKVVMFWNPLLLEDKRIY